MVHEKAGHIINLASILGTNGASCEVAYSATKGAVVAFTRALAKELGPSGIRVNCVAPGCIDTDMIANLSPEDKAELADSTSLCRMGTAEDVADAGKRARPVRDRAGVRCGRRTADLKHGT